MKHPMDTSAWGEFKLDDLFEFMGSKQVKSQHNLIETDKENGIPFVVQSNQNNMVKCYVTKESLTNNTENIYKGNVLVLGVVTPVASYQSEDFGASQSIILKSDKLNPLRGQFLVSVIRSVIESKYNYSNIPGIQKYKQDVIPLPLKPSANPSNYTQEDIDWDYMETVMSRVTARAKDRLANLPQPSEKQKTPVDTSAWGEFVVGELFDMIQGRRLKKADFIEGDIPYVMASSYNNGVITHIDNPITTGQDLLTADIFGDVFYQPSFIGFGDDNCGLKLKNYKATKYQYLFLATVFKKFQNEASFTNKLRGSWYIKQTIKLPLKPSADPSNYDQTDIDWTYMETVMERVTARAKDRLANLPQPSEKQKTPVDASAWGEFVVGELFDMIQGRRLKKADFIEGDIPYVMASSYNNGVITHIDNPITTGQDLLTADIFGNVFYQPSFIGFGDDNCGLKLKNYKATKYQYLFLATVFKKFQNEASFTNKLRGSWYIKQTIKLPLKASTNPSDYTQDDIDWDYTENFMKAIEEKAHDRLKSLKKTIA